MMNSDTKKWLTDLLGDRVRFDEPMSRHTSFRVGGPADAYITPETQEELVRLTTGARERGLKHTIIGAGTNLLVKDNGIKGLVIVLTKFFKKRNPAFSGRGIGPFGKKPGFLQTDMREDGSARNPAFSGRGGIGPFGKKPGFLQTDMREDGSTIVTAMAGCGLRSLCGFSIKQGLEGMNFALGIPGTVGGAVMMNAGTGHGAMADVLKSLLLLLPTGQTQKIRREELHFDYRRFDRVQTCKEIGYSISEDDEGPVILEASFRLHPSDPATLKKEAAGILKTRRKTQPSGYPSAGCFFKNPRGDEVSSFGCQVPKQMSAGSLIDQAGLKGKRIGGAEVSARHANFIINRAGASATDILALADLIQKEVSDKFGVHLEPEVRIGE